MAWTLRSPPTPFKDLIRLHFARHVDEITHLYRAYLTESKETGEASSSGSSSASTPTSASTTSSPSSSTTPVTETNAASSAKLPLTHTPSRGFVRALQGIAPTLEALIAANREVVQKQAPQGADQ
jgi:cytoskeletal protein RodZ